MQREIKLFVVSDDRHNRQYIQAVIGNPGSADDVIDLGFDGRTDADAVHNLLRAINAEPNRNLTAVDPDSLPASITRVSQMIAKAIDDVFTKSGGAVIPGSGTRAARLVSREDTGYTAEAAAKVPEPVRDFVDKMNRSTAARKRRRRRRARKTAAPVTIHQQAAAKRRRK